MADKEEWIVDGYQFGSAKDATQAKAELLKIQKLEDKMDYRNPHMVYMVYHKAIENRIFKTPIGYEYLRKLQKHLKENPLIREPVQDVPVNNVYSLRDSTNPAVEKVKASAKPKPKQKQRIFQQDNIYMSEYSTGNSCNRNVRHIYHRKQTYHIEL
mgnify:CR=1 FL=1